MPQYLYNTNCSEIWSHISKKIPINLRCAMCMPTSVYAERKTQAEGLTADTLFCKWYFSFAFGV